MSPVRYSTMTKSKDKGFLFGVRLQMIRDALETGIKPVARLYGVSRNTVKKWFRRYKQGGTSLIIDKSRRPHKIPHKTPESVEQEIIRHKKSKPYLGAKRLKRDFDIPCSHGAIHRIMKQNGLIGTRRKKKKKRRNLRHIKDMFRAFERNSIDTKHLRDIPMYLPQMRILGLPEYEYTFRDQKTGGVFAGYADELSLVHATVFADVIGEWIKRHGVEIKGSVWQHDGGSEFIGSWNAKGKSGFIKKVEDIGAEHFQIPKVTYNADVETFHRTVEDEFFDIERFKGRDNFFRKATSYIWYYNFLRKNSNRKDKSPLEILEETRENINPQVMLLPALDLDELLNQKLKADLGGHHVARLSFL